MPYFDLVMPAVSFAQGFGRFGCFFAGCCYGRETDAWYGITFHNSSFAPNGVKLIPTQLISAAGDFIICALLLWFASKRPKTGRVAAAYLVGVYVLPADEHSARCRLKQGVEVLGKGRFAASGVPDDADKLPVRNAYIYIFYRNSAKRGALAIYMAQALHGNISHFLSSL